MMNSGNVSVNDFLLELAKVANERLTNNGQTSHHANQSPRRHSIDMIKNTSTPILKSGSEYPEVTLHPVTNQDASGASASNSNSLLHGILTKQQNARQQPGGLPTNTPGFTSFSPTLARLLTAPERISPLIPGFTVGQNTKNNNNNNIHSFHAKSLLGQDLTGGVVNLTNKPKSEITITPVVNSITQSLQQSLIQNQLEQKHIHQQYQQHLDSLHMNHTKNPDSLMVVSFFLPFKYQEKHVFKMYWSMLG